MQQQSDVWAFIIEAYKRMSLKSPKFFQVIQAIGMIAAFITGIPLAIQQFEMTFGVHIDLPFPEAVNSTWIRVVFFCGVLAKIIAKLPVVDPKKPVDASGNTQPVHAVMPYTAKKKEEATVVPIDQKQGA